MEILISIGNKIGFDWKLALTHLINFLIIFFLLVKFALPAVRRVIEERTAKIKEGLRMREEADKIKAEAETKALETKRSASLKSQEIISSGEVTAKNIVEDAHQKSAEILRQANLEKDKAKEVGLKEAESLLEKDLVKILTKISELAFDKKISPENNSEFVSKVFKSHYSH